jgi:hypothetical protein
MLAVPLRGQCRKSAVAYLMIVSHHGAHHENPQVRSIRNCRSDYPSRVSIPAAVHATLVFFGDFLSGLYAGWIRTVF